MNALGESKFQVLVHFVQHLGVNLGDNIMNILLQPIECFHIFEYSPNTDDFPIKNFKVLRLARALDTLTHPSKKQDVWRNVNGRET